MDPKENGETPALGFASSNGYAPGLTKREHFAAMMMPAFLAKFDGARSVVDAASEAVYAADELLRALAAGGEA